MRSLYLIGVSISIQVIFQSLITLMQFFLQQSIGLQSLGEHELDPNVYGVSVVSIGLTRILRPYGLTEHPNILGGCLAFSLILLFAAYLYGDQGIRRVILLIFALGLPALFVTFSRSAWLAFLLGTMILLGMSILQRGWYKVSSFLWLGLLSTLVLAPFIWQYAGYIGVRLNVGNSFQINADENRSLAQRLNLDELGFRIFLQNSLSGIGLGASALAINQFHVSNPVPPHLVLLAVAMETGVLGLILYAALLCLPFIALLKKKIRKPVHALLTTLSVLLIAITLVGFFDIYPWLLQPGRIWQWLAWGLWAVAYEMTDEDLKSVHMSTLWCR
jgi:O-antigen ligase